MVCLKVSPAGRIRRRKRRVVFRMNSRESWQNPCIAAASAQTNCSFPKQSPTTVLHSTAHKRNEDMQQLHQNSFPAQRIASCNDLTALEDTNKPPPITFVNASENDMQYRPSSLDVLSTTTATTIITTTTTTIAAAAAAAAAEEEEEEKKAAPDAPSSAPHRRSMPQPQPLQRSVSWDDSRLRLRRQPSLRRQYSLRRSKRSRWLIPADHPFKIIWDVLTILLSFLSVYNLHGAIRDRKFGPSPLVVFCDTWFFIDILLNFVTEHKTSDGKVLRDGKSVWARYLTTWFAIDVLSLFPWEMLYVKPIIEMQKRRGFFKKTFFRTRAVIRVTRILRGRHFKLFGKVARQTKHAGVGARRLLRILIKYVPKYLLFFRHMKGALAVRTLRQVHWAHKIIKAFSSSGKKDDDTESLTQVPNDDDDEEDDDEWEDDYHQEGENEGEEAYLFLRDEAYRPEDDDGMPF